MQLECFIAKVPPWKATSVDSKPQAFQAQFSLEVVGVGYIHCTRELTYAWVWRYQTSDLLARFG